MFSFRGHFCNLMKLSDGSAPFRPAHSIKPFQGTNAEKKSFKQTSFKSHHQEFVVVTPKSRKVTHTIFMSCVNLGELK